MQKISCKEGYFKYSACFLKKKIAAWKLIKRRWIQVSRHVTLCQLINGDLTAGNSNFALNL